MSRDAGRELIAGTLGGMAGVTAGHPLDTVKTWLQHHAGPGKHITAVALTRTLLRDGKLFAGIRYPLLSNAPINALVFWSNAGVHTSLPPTWHSTVRDCVAGASAGAVCSVVVSPSELLKCRTQTTATHCSEPWTLARGIVREQGLRGLYRGFGATLMRESPSYATWFAVYEGCKRYQPQSVGIQVAASALAGISAWTISFPVDVAKTIIQTRCDSQPTPNTTSVLLDLYRQHGMRSWFRGWVPAVARAGPVSVVTFSVYEKMLGLL